MTAPHPHAPSTAGPGATPTGTQWLTSEEETAWRGLLRLHAKLSSVLGRDMAAHGDISLTDYGVLVALTDYPGGRLRAFELGEQLGWEKSRLSHHVARMARRGLVVRERCPTDERGLYVAVTDRGREALAAAAPGHVATVRRAFVDVLTPEQLAAMTNVAETVLDAIDRCAPAGGGPSAARHRG
ncbi:MAG: MarR family winged helix-turn-helix transcriptional regulator [Acidimicrobiales bacterium]